MKAKNCSMATLSLGICFCSCDVGAAAPLPPGKGEQVIELQQLGLTVFTYRPPCREPSLLIVFHGQRRDADRYRDYARTLADRHCMLIVAPQLDKERFPQWRYQHGGIVQKGVVQDPQQWTGNIVVELVEYLRRSEGRNMPYSFLGHSAGGQFLSRLSAFVPTEATRIVIANPGTHVFPDLKVKAPFGMGGVYPQAAAEGSLRRYLEQPITIFLGQDDLDEDPSDRAEATAQGATRHERGLNAFRAAQSLAQSSSWTFNWRLVELPGAGHSARKMFSSEEAWEALTP
jgi:dienelactone hydrolase